MKVQRLMVMVLGVMVAVSMTNSETVQAGDPIITQGSGTGTYYPAKGYYTAIGNVDAFGESVSQGRVESEFTGPLTLSWQNFGNANGNGNGSPRNEVLERVVFEGGTLYTRSKQLGTVQLTPDGPPADPMFPELGPFTAEWVAEIEVVKGTGIFKGAKGDGFVTATNDSFLVTDPAWTFTWTYNLNIRLTGRNK